MENLKKIFAGRRAALVGHAAPKRDFSEEIDAADVVVRLNHCGGLETGLVGRRIDALVLAPCTAYFAKTRAERHCAEIRAARPRVFVAKNFFLTKTREFAACFEGLSVEPLSVPAEAETFTTGTKALLAVRDAAPAELRAFCFSETEAEFLAYLRRDGPWHLRSAAAELAARQRKSRSA